MKPKKIGFFGLFGQQNIGNDCTLQAILSHTRLFLPNAEIMCSCTGPEDISTRFSISTFPLEASQGKVWAGKTSLLMKILRKVLIHIPMELLHWFKAVNYLRGTQMLIAPGTGLLVDHTTGPFGFPYYVFKWSLIAKFCRCKLLFVSIGAGPIYHKLSRWFIKSALSMADYRSYRDNFSKKYIYSIGFDSNSDPVYPDLAFSLSRAIMPENDNHDMRAPVIGVGLIDYRGPSSAWERRKDKHLYCDYVGEIASFLKWLYGHNYTVRILIGDVRYDSSVKSELMELLEKRGLKFDDRKIISEPIFTEEQLLLELAKTDIVVSPRFHNIIFALMLNKPVVSISYNEKFDELMKDVGLAEYCLHIDRLDINKLVEKVIKLEKSAEGLKHIIKDKTEEYRRALDEQYLTIFNANL